jgi:hypothetical protein
MAATLATTQNKGNQTMAHPFETAGLGLAPFRFVGLFEKVCSGQPDANGVSVGYAGQPAGTCDYCGAGIRYCCQVRSADGREFVVGCDCVDRVGDADNQLTNAVADAKKAVERKARAARNEIKKAKEQARIAAAVAALETARPTLAAQPHPVAVLAGRLSAADYVDYLLANAGHSGKLAAARLIEKAAG